MKIKEGFKLRKVLDHYVVIPLDEATSSFKGMIHLNETSAFLWKLIEDGINTKEKLLKMLLDHYQVTEDTAIKDIDCFIETLHKHHVIEL